MEKPIQAVDRTTQFGEDSIGSLMARYSLPSIVAMLASTMFNLINMAFVGRTIGALGIAAIAVCGPITMINGAISAFISNGCAAAVAISLGRGERDQAQSLLGCSVTFNLIVAMINISLGYGFMEPLLRAFGASDTILPYAKEYMMVTLFGMMFSAFTTMNPMLRTEGFPQKAMYTQFIMAGLNIVFTPTFLYIFNMGIGGAALGTLCAQFATAAYIYLFLINKNRVVRLQLQFCKLRFDVIKWVMELGLPTFLMQLTQNLLSVVMNRSLGAYGGDIAISAWGVTNNVNNLVAQPVFGLNQAVQPIIGYNIGAKLYKRVKQALFYSLGVATFFSVLGWLVIWLFPAPILGFFSTDAELIEIGRRMLIVFRMLIFVTGFQQAGAVYFQYIGKPGTSILLTLSRQVFILMPCVMILPRFFQFDGILYAGPISDGLSTILTALFILREIRRLDVIIKESEAEEAGAATAASALV